jgi:hypothetical protein
MEKFNNIDIIATVTHGIIALVFATIKQVNDVAKFGFNKLKFFTGMIVGSFVGVAVYFFCQDLIPNKPYFIAFFTSVSSWAGGQMMDFFTDLIQKYITKKLDVQVEISTEDEETSDNEQTK